MAPETLIAVLRQAYLWSLGIGFVLVLIAEPLIPLVPIGAENQRARHVIRNLSLALVSRLVVGIVIGVWILDFERRLFAPGWGVLGGLPLPLPALVVIGVLAVDFGQYVFHRLLHRYRWLWMVHSVHHSDVNVDVSTSLRFHPVEGALNLLWRVVLLGILGLPLWLVGAQTVLMIPVALFQHANLRVPQSIDRALRWMVVTPGLHKLHHSPLPIDNNSNFGEVFPFWDRLFGTLRESERERSTKYGLPNLGEECWQSVGGMLATPWRARHLDAL